MDPAFGTTSRLPCLHVLACLRRIGLTLVLMLLAGCALPPKTTTETLSERTYWSGRLVVQVEEQATQSFAAAFELQGNATHGELTLLSPLGTVLAQLQWEPGRASLQSSGQTRTSESLDVLLEQMTGTPLPVLALFSWLRGLQTAVSGWQADLDNIDHGQLVATRYEPAPRTTLRVAFER